MTCVESHTLAVQTSSPANPCLIHAGHLISDAVIDHLDEIYNESRLRAESAITPAGPIPSERISSDVLHLANQFLRCRA